MIDLRNDNRVVTGHIHWEYIKKTHYVGYVNRISNPPWAEYQFRGGCYGENSDQDLIIHVGQRFFFKKNVSESSW